MVYAVEDIARALKEAREAKSLSQRALSGKVGLTQAHISSIENAGSDPRLSNLLELARALDLEVMLVPRKAVPAVQGIVRNIGAVSSPSLPPSKTVRYLQGSFDKLESTHPQPQEIAELRSIVSSFRALDLDKEQIHAVTAAGRDLRNLSAALQKADAGGSEKSTEMKRLTVITNRLRAIRNAALHAVPTENLNRVLRAYELDDGGADG